MLKINEDIFIIPIKSGINIIYAPLHSVAFYANQIATDEICSYLSNGIVDSNIRNSNLYSHINLLNNTNKSEPTTGEIDVSSNLVIILSQLCNLACSYCYAQESRSKIILDREKLRNAIDYILNQASRNKYFSFIGGGEPTITWDLLQWAISYIRDSSSFPQNKIGIGITTNGTLLNSSRIIFLAKNKIRVSLSFEILPDIQNTQRIYSNNLKETFDIIDSVIKELSRNQIRLSFRSTITPLNVNRMKEMVLFSSKRYPEVKFLHFEPVTADLNTPTFYDDFIKEFIIAKKEAEKRGIELYCSISRNLKKIKRCFCRGELCITPTGEVVSCHRVSSDNISSFDKFKYAESTIDGFSIDDIAKEKVIEMHNSRNIECNSCFLKWHCAGSCTMEQLTLSKKQLEMKCRFIQNLSIELIKNQLPQL